MVEVAPDYPISSQLRRKLLEKYPALQARSDYRYLTAYLLYGTWHDPKSGELVIHGSLLAAMQDDVKGYKQNNHCGLKFLEGFQRDVFPLEYRCYDLYKEKARRIISSGICPEIVKAAISDLYCEPDVWFGSGNSFDHRLSGVERRYVESGVLNSPAKPKCNEASLVLNYLNGLSSTSFTRTFNRNFGRARDAVELLPEIARDREYKILRAIQRQAKPYYKPVLGSSRLYPENTSLLNLKREVRNALTANWIDADLKGAQLAIIAKLWTCPLTLQILESGRSVWEVLADQAGVRLSSKSKASIKELVYRTAFGSSSKTIRHIGNQTLGKRSTGQLLGSPIFSELLARRSTIMRNIEDSGHAIDAFGNRLEYDSKGRNHRVLENRRWNQGSNLLSLLAEQAQSYELKLLFPIFQLAIGQDRDDRHGFDIRTLLYDGLSFTCRDSKDEPKFKSLLKALVAKEANALGIPTELEIG